MATNQVIKGENIMLFADSKSIGFATSHALSVNISMVDCSHKDVNGGSFYEGTAGLVEWEVSSENFIGNPTAGLGYNDILAMALKREPVDVVMAQKSIIAKDGEPFEVSPNGWTAATNDGFKGKAIITSVSCNFPNAENSTMSITMKGIGALEPVKKNS